LREGYRALDRVYIPLDTLKAGHQRRGAGCRAHRRNCSPACMGSPAPGVMLEQAPLAGADRRHPACHGNLRYRHPGASLRAVATDPTRFENVRLGKFSVAALGALGAAKDCSVASAAPP
jgi:hypothetical protein